MSERILRKEGGTMTTDELARELRGYAECGYNAFEYDYGIDVIQDALSRSADELESLEAENAELRVLCADMFNCISHANEADWFYFERDKPGCGMSCTVNGESCGLCALADRMRELGIEVDE